MPAAAADVEIEGGSTFALGRLGLSFGGSDPVLPHVVGEMMAQPLAAAGTSRATLEFNFSDDAFVDRDWVIVGAVSAVDGRIEVSEGRLTYQLPTAGPHTVVPVRSRLGRFERRPARELVRLADASFLNAPGRLAKRFFYNIFDQVVQVVQLPIGQSWLHASAVTNGDRTVVLAAWGGVGKTSSLLKLLETGRWQYLSDDLAVIDEQGGVYRTPQRMQIYAYNLVGQPALRDSLLRGRRVLDLAQWHARQRVLGPKAVRRRVHPHEVFGQAAVADHGDVTDLVFLRRSSSATFRISETTADRVAPMCASVLDHELNPLVPVAAAANSTGFVSPVPPVDDLRVRTEEVIARALAANKPRCLIIDVPGSSGPNELFNFLHQELGL